MIGRLLTKRRRLAKSRHWSCQVLTQLIDWLWELPIIVAITIISYEVSIFYSLPDRSAMVIAIAVGYIGLDTIKVIIINYLNERGLK